MKIIYLHQHFNIPSIPDGTRSYEMARRLVAKGHEVHMVTSWRETGGHTDWFQTEEDGIFVHWLPVPYSNDISYGQRIRAFVRFAQGAARKAASLDGDIVFATSTPLTIALPAVYAAWRKRVPMVFEVRDLWPEFPIAMGALRNLIMRWVARRLDSVFQYGLLWGLAFHDVVFFGLMFYLLRSRYEEVPTTSPLRVRVSNVC